jgi:hypothetical protein
MSFTENQNFALMRLVKTKSALNITMPAAMHAVLPNAS